MMKKIRIHLFLLLVLPTMLIKGQSISKEIHYIEVSGTAKLECIPDEIFISFTIIEKFVTTGASQQEKISVEKQEEKLKKELENLGENLKNLSMVPVSKGVPAADTPGKKYILKVSSPSSSEKVFTYLEKLEIRGARISNQRYSKIEEVKKEARIQAMKSAKEKAEYMLAAIGEQTGKVILVQEKECKEELQGTETSFTQQILPGTLGATEIRNIKIQAEVLARFEIK